MYMKFSKTLGCCMAPFPLYFHTSTRLFLQMFILISIFTVECYLLIVRILINEVRITSFYHYISSSMILKFCVQNFQFWPLCYKMSYSLGQIHMHIYSKNTLKTIFFLQNKMMSWAQAVKEYLLPLNSPQNDLIVLILNMHFVELGFYTNGIVYVVTLTSFSF